MEELEGSARGVSLRAAACMLAGDARDPVSGERVRRAVDAQLRRAGVAAQDAGDVRTDVVLALLSAPAADLPAAARARVRPRRGDRAQQGRRPRPPQRARADRVRRRPARAASRWESARVRSPTGSTRSRRRRTGGACAPISRARSRASTRRSAPPSRAHAGGGAARASGLPRSTYYRALAHAQARLRSDLRGRLAGLGALGDLARGARELFAHAEASARRRGRRHGRRRRRRRARAQRCPRAETPPRVPGADRRCRRSGGRVHPVRRDRAARGARRCRAARDRSPPATPACRLGPPRAGRGRSQPRSTPCTYDPSAYDC